MANFKRYDTNQVKAIVKYIRGLKAAKGKKPKQPLPLSVILFAVTLRFRATAREICAALFRDWIGEGPPSTDWMIYYTQFKRKFNSDERERFNEVIAVKEPVIKNGKKGIVWIDVLASGKDAATAAENNKPMRDGYNNKIDRLEQISVDKKLRQRHLRRLRQIESQDQNDGNTEEESK